MIAKEQVEDPLSRTRRARLLVAWNGPPCSMCKHGELDVQKDELELCDVRERAVLPDSDKQKTNDHDSCQEMMSTAGTTIINGRRDVALQR
jgi:hypothetical protein